MAQCINAPYDVAITMFDLIPSYTAVSAMCYGLGKEWVQHSSIEFYDAAYVGVHV